MYPNLHFFLESVFGELPWLSGLRVVQTFGFFLALVFLIGGWIAMKELQRKEKEGVIKGTPETFTTGALATPTELIINAIIGYLIGYKMLYVAQNWSAFIADAQSIVISPKGSLIGGILGAIGFAAFKYWDKWRVRLDNPKTETVMVMPHERIGDLVLVAAISGLIGAKIFAVIEDMDALLADPIGMLFSGAGLAVYGGLIGAFIVTGLYARSKKIDLLQLMDACAPTLILGYGIGRLGCHFSGDGDWGIANTAPKPGWLPDWLWAFDYPNNVISECASKAADNTILNADCNFAETPYLITPVWPTSVYEVLMAVAIFALLWFLRKRIKVPGVLFFIYLIFNGLERSFIERIRINDRYNILGMHPTQAEVIAFFFCIIGIGMIIYLTKRHKKNQASTA